ncbi:invasion associated locus B family protein [Mesorhizobium sp. BAC0120]|uniref:invasion associated locus B family protein n=1 Tax=Mesorhizobium sp. BAC0120 TaxID=3090670 RepID=UPI00298D29F1|nr:invasion associated locus B family protein [Mesorhizobium sp. BAC0120]MDW6023141.1 invasion associated locus B family protein [Mesorhizobium sp. BAC0120]
MPGGASSLQETYQDWRLACQTATPQHICSLSQQQTQQSGQRILAIELRKDGNNGLSGNLILPFGLLLDAGVILQIDDGQKRAPLRFSTCLPAGCVVPLSFDAEYIAALQSGTVLHVRVQSADAKELGLSISLKGFSAGLDRLQALGS